MRMSCKTVKTNAILPDPLTIHISYFSLINRVMLDGKRGTAAFNQATELNKLKEATGNDARSAFAKQLWKIDHART